MRKLSSLALCTGLFLLFACISTRERYNLDLQQLTESVVYLDNFYLYPVACGLVVAEDEQFSYILTVWHAVHAVTYASSDQPEVLEEGEIVTFFFGSTPVEIVAVQELFVRTANGPIPTELIQADRGLDLALLRVPKLWFEPVDWAGWSEDGEEVVVVGRSGATHVVSITQGHVMGFDTTYKRMIVSATSHPGCSGGPVMVNRFGKWVAIGIVSAVGNDGVHPIHHITFVVPEDSIQSWISVPGKDEV